MSFFPSPPDSPRTRSQDPLRTFECFGKDGDGKVWRVIYSARQYHVFDVKTKGMLIRNPEVLHLMDKSGEVFKTVYPWKR